MQNEKLPAILSHGLGIPTLFVGPLLMYFLFKGKASPWLRAHLDESVNHRLLVLVAVVVLVVLAVVFTTVGLPMVALLVGALAVFVLALSVLLAILAMVRAGQGKAYHYPLDVRMIR